MRFCLQSIISDMEKVCKQPRKLKRGSDLLEWIEQEMPTFRERLKQEASFGDPDEIKHDLVELIHGHIRAVLHPGDTVKQFGCLSVCLSACLPVCTRERVINISVLTFVVFLSYSMRKAVCRS